MNSPVVIFDEAALEAHRRRARAGFAGHNILFEEMAAQIVERLGDIKYDFQSALDLSAHESRLGDYLRKRVTSFSHRPVAERDYLALPASSADLIASNLTLHWINDLPGVLAQIHKALKTGGLFIATLIGGSSLHELRTRLMDAEIAVSGGVSPRLSPTVDMPTASALLQRAGFQMPVTDEETVTLAYENSYALMRDLRGMGETNAHAHRVRHCSRRALFALSDTLYRERFGGDDGHIPATFDVVFLHGVKG